MSSPTQRSLAHFRKLGFTAAVVEKWNPHAKIRQDLFGCIDIVVLSDEGTIGVQACNVSDVSKRVIKISDSEHIGAIRKAGWRVLVQGWGKEANGRYRLREVDCS
jgi:hypothetical protein